MTGSSTNPTKFPLDILSSCCGTRTLHEFPQQRFEALPLPLAVADLESALVCCRVKYLPGCEETAVRNFQPYGMPAPLPPWVTRGESVRCLSNNAVISSILRSGFHSLGGKIHHMMTSRCEKGCRNGREPGLACVTQAIWCGGGGIVESSSSSEGGGPACR